MENKKLLLVEDYEAPFVYNDVLNQILDADGFPVADDLPSDTVADFIVRACNSHYKLLEALKSCHAIDGYGFDSDSIEALITKAEAEHGR